MKIMQAVLVLVLFSAFTSVNQAWAKEDAKDSLKSRWKDQAFSALSKDLTTAGIVVIPVLNKGAKVVALAMTSEFDQKEKFLLGDDGKLYRLEGKLSLPNAKWGDGCSEGEQPAVELSFTDKKDHKGSFIAIGSNIEKVITWAAPKATETKAQKCILQSLKQEAKGNVSASLYSLPGAPQSVYVTTWKVSGGMNAENCQGDAEIVSVGTLNSSNNTCHELDRTARDCDGKSTSGSSKLISKFLGHLELNGKAKWIVFETEGYDGNSGFVFYPLDKLGAPINAEAVSLSLIGFGC